MTEPQHPVDPVNLEPIPPLRDSYVYHSKEYRCPPATETGEDDGWIMGIDEAGRGRESFSHSIYCLLLQASVRSKLDTQVSSKN